MTVGTKSCRKEDDHGRVGNGKLTRIHLTSEVFTRVGLSSWLYLWVCLDLPRQDGEREKSIPNGQWFGSTYVLPVSRSPILWVPVYPYFLDVDQ